jgi:hypothetical protein
MFNLKYLCKIDRKFHCYCCFFLYLFFYNNRRFNDVSQLPQTLNRQTSSGSNGTVNSQSSTGGRWDAILAERQMSTNSSGNSNNHQRGGSSGGLSGNRNNRDNGGSGYGGQRDNNYGRRDHESHRPYHSHVGGQSGDTTGADWSTPLPANASLER